MDTKTLPEPPAPGGFLPKGSFIGKNPNSGRAFAVPFGLQYLEWLVDRIIAEVKRRTGPPRPDEKPTSWGWPPLLPGRRSNLDLNARPHPRAGDLQLREVVKYMAEHLRRTDQSKPTGGDDLPFPQAFYKDLWGIFKPPPMNFVTAAGCNGPVSYWREKTTPSPRWPMNAAFPTATISPGNLRRPFEFPPSEYRTRVAKQS